MNNYKRNPDGSVEPVEDVLEWARWFEGSADVRVIAILGLVMAMRVRALDQYERVR